MNRFLLITLICVLLISAYACADTVGPGMPTIEGEHASADMRPGSILGVLNLDETIYLDGNGEGRVFDGIGGMSAGASTRLLVDYPEPQRSQILDFLFKPNFGASLHVQKCEIGGTVNTTWGSELSFANTREEFENPKPEYFARGYEVWLMQEAKKRNPDMIFETLQWGAPGWIEKGEFFSQDNADFIAKYIKGLRDYCGININYQGLRNEAGYNIAWAKVLRKTLDRYGLQDVKLVGADDAGDMEWKIAKEVQADPELSEALYALTIHYVPYTSTDLAKSLGKPLWYSEAATYGEPWGRAMSFARLYNRNYIIGRMTKTLVNTPTTSNFDYLAPFNTPLFNNPGFLIANTPWSGYYKIPPEVWATAHTTQFAKPGWRYLNAGCGLFKTAGSYVTLTDGKGNYSIIAETLNNYTYDEAGFDVKDNEPYVPSRRVVFNLKNLSTGPVHVWRSNQHSQFEQLEDIIPDENGAFAITLDGNSIYSLTTTTGQQKGSYDIPENSPFPFPYKDDFESYAPGSIPKYFSDQEGNFTVEKRADGKGKCLRQIVPQKGVRWFVNFQSPWAITGDAAWKDYEVSADVHIGDKGSTSIYGRIDDALSRPMPGGYGLGIDNTGTWELKDTTTVIESGKVKTAPDKWHNLKLIFSGAHVVGVIDGKTVCSVTDTSHANGAAGVAGSYDYVEFDNFAVKPLKGQKPKTTAGWENLALGAKATASSQSSNNNSADKAVDGSHKSGWSPEPGKTAGEWLEIDFGKETTFDRTIVGQPQAAGGIWTTVGGITDYKIQYWNGDDWKDATVGSGMGVRQMDDFSPITASKVRLLITASGEGGCIYEFQVFRHKR